MLALSPPLFPTIGWPLEDPLTHEQNNNNIYIEEAQATTSDQSLLLSQPIAGSLGDEKPMTKKLNHNATERNRRKRINSLYSSLRSLLPAADHAKKLSIPATVSLVLKYIPELQLEVEKLVQYKEELISTINSRQQGSLVAIPPSSSAVFVSSIGDKEIAIQICTTKFKKGVVLSEILINLEVIYGLVVLNASWFESFGDRVFYNLHFQVQGSQRLNFDRLREKVLSFL